MPVDKVSSSRFNPLDYPICLDIPERLTNVDFWHEHIPFAFTLIQMLKPQIFVELGTHKGDSYCAFCQAVSKLNTSTKCYAVDTWEGDEHVGHYEESIYNELKAYHDPRYGSFSTMLRSLFDEAVTNFADKSIDLLHIDGLHTYDAVKHDFETWLPKMSEQGIIIFHDTDVREESFAERGYEVWRFFEEVSQRYPSYEFKFGNGLGIIAVGSAIPEPLLPLLGYDKEQAQLVGKIFFALGYRIHSISLENKRKQETENVQTYIDSLKTHVDSLSQALTEVDQDRAAIRTLMEAEEEEHQKVANYLKVIELDRKQARTDIEIIRNELEITKNYLGTVEADRKNLVVYVGSVEEKYKELQQQNSNLSQTLENKVGLVETIKGNALNKIGKIRGRISRNK